MRKFYTTFAALLVAVAVSATTAIGFTKGDSKLKTAEFANIQKIESVGEICNQSNLMPASRAASAFEDISGKYVVSVTRVVNNNSCFVMDIVPTQKADEYLVKGFIYSDSKDIKATVEVVDWGTAEKPLELPTLVFEELPLLFEDEDGENRLLFAKADLKTGATAGLYRDAIMIPILNGELMWAFSEEYGFTFGTQTTDGKWSIVYPYYNVNFTKVNGEFTSDLYTSDEEPTVDTGAEFACDVAVVTDEAVENMLIYNVGDLGSQLLLTVDEASQTATVLDNQVMQTIAVQGKSVPFYAYAFNAGLTNVLNTMDVQINITDDNKTVLNFPVFGPYNSTYGFLLIDNDHLALYANAKVTLNYNLFTGEAAGVDVPVVDAADEDAPVEYFNLQGQKVVSPRTGSLYIVRQGSKVTKTVVR